ncbi:MAG: hypothetical protein ACLFPQ_01825 [Candidatus Woesearchaeota archaeon]
MPSKKDLMKIIDDLRKERIMLKNEIKNLYERNDLLKEKAIGNNTTQKINVLNTLKRYFSEGRKEDAEKLIRLYLKYYRKDISHDNFPEKGILLRIDGKIYRLKKKEDGDLKREIFSKIAKHNKELKKARTGKIDNPMLSKLSFINAPEAYICENYVLLQEIEGIRLSDLLETIKKEKRKNPFAKKLLALLLKKMIDNLITLQLAELEDTKEVYEYHSKKIKESFDKILYKYEIIANKDIYADLERIGQILDKDPYFRLRYINPDNVLINLSSVERFFDTRRISSLVNRDEQDISIPEDKKEKIIDLIFKGLNQSTFDDTKRFLLSNIFYYDISYKEYNENDMQDIFDHVEIREDINLLNDLKKHYHEKIKNIKESIDEQRYNFLFDELEFYNKLRKTSLSIHWMEKTRTMDDNIQSELHEKLKELYMYLYKIRNKEKPREDIMNKCNSCDEKGILKSLISMTSSVNGITVESQDRIKKVGDPF